MKQPTFYKTLLFSLLLAGYCMSANAQKTSSLTFNKPKQTKQAQHIISKLERAYANLGVEVKLIDYIHKNSLQAANLGILDGQLARIGCLQDKYPNLRHSNFPIYELSLLLITRKNSCHNCTVNELQSVSYFAGYPFAKAFMNEMNYTGKTVAANSIAPQLAMLKQHQIDGVLVIDYLLEHEISKQALTQFEIKKVSTKAIYHYLHKSHEPLLRKLDQELIKLYGTASTTLYNEHHSH